MEIPANPALLEKIRSGGYVLYMRHGRTDPHQPDQVPIDLEDCATQRPLIDQGRAEIIMVGKALRRAGIPISTVLVSPLCRAVESALLAFGPDFQVENKLMYTAHLTSRQKLPIIARTLELIATPVSEPEQNRMLVAHAPNLADIMGYFPEREGTVIVFRPLGNGKYEYIASILPEDWDGLLDYQ
ncbi:phosphohistidine phosphatase SixA [Desulfobotulus alkaliphilus]|uniref:Phosphohistidine phosphatase SixA n=2 Tax=Desulfobotulus alkaliphilus TaxID=622671 RepID=A0A562R871_9BACT|nr:phosphohistidine phosphatase SixA [Desulfobotulus alkaliphilus]